MLSAISQLLYLNQYGSLSPQLFGQSQFPFQLHCHGGVILNLVVLLAKVQHGKLLLVEVHQQLNHGKLLLKPLKLLQFLK
jgi:hypothetical protein